MIVQQNTMTPKEYLAQAYHLDLLINSKLEQASRLRALATKVTAHMSDMPKGSSGSKSTMENTIVKLVDLEKEIDADIDAFVDMKRDIAEKIHCVRHPKLSLLLEMRYLAYMKWAEIAEVLEMDVRYVHKLHGKALVCVGKDIFFGGH